MQKKTMKNNVYLLLGLFLLFGVLPFASAGGEGWTSYGNGYFPSHQFQYDTGFSYFDDVINNLTSTYSGQSQFAHPTQPIVSSFGGQDILYTIVSSGNYLRMFDEDLNLYTEIYVGMDSMGQMGAIDWNSDGNIDIAGYWRENATEIHFKVYSVNHISQLFEEIYDYNFTHPSTNGVTGVRCDGDTCYTVLYDTAGVGTSTYWTDLQISKSTGVIAHLLYADKQSYTPIEPPSFDDYDNNGKMDFIVFSQDRVAVYDEDGTVLQNWTYPNTVGYYNYVKSAKFFNSDASPYMKIAIAREIPYQTYSSGQCPGSYSCVRLDIKSVVDGSNVVTVEPLSSGSSSSGNPRFQGLAIYDYNGDGYDDVWITASRLGTSPVGVLDIYKGDGTNFYVSSFIDDEYFGSNYPQNSLTLARMDDDSQYDAIINTGGTLRIWSPALDNMVYTSSLSVTSGQAGCVPVDLNYDGALDLLCADTNSLELLSPNITNQNAYITQVAYDPSTLVAVNQTLTAIITAVDLQSDNILYRHRCKTSDNWSAEDGSNTKNCVYDAVGTYDLTVGVRDGYHPDDYDTFLQTITVTSTGAVCDNDFICEANQGETYLSCPNDCSAPTGEEIEGSTTATGGMPLPTTLVDVNNINHGLLPEIYYGTLGFMSSVLSPTILVVFVIFFALIMLTIGGIIRKIGEKASMGGR
jgi:hypothetical protein